MSEGPVYKTQVVATLTKDGVWKVVINLTNLPLSGREITRLHRHVMVEARKSLREFNLKQRAQQRLVDAGKVTAQAVKVPERTVV